MPDEEHSCLLRRLTLCDGERSVQPTARANPCGCYCAAVDELQAQGDDLGASEHRAARARVVARAATLERIMRFRQNPPY